MRSIPLAGRVVRRLTGKSPGQIVVMFMLLSGLAGFVGVLTLDVGFWLAERRDAQGDADAIALAGAMELPIFDGELDLEAGESQEDDVAPIAIAAAEAWASANGVDPDSELELAIVWNEECFPGSTPSGEAYVGVTAIVTRTAPSIFIGLISDVLDQNALTTVSVTATACTGVPVEATGFVPWIMTMDGDCFDDDGMPKYGERCVLVASAGSGATGNFGRIAIDPDSTTCPGSTNNGVPTYEGNIRDGVDFVCGVGDSLSANPGIAANSTLGGIQARLALYPSGEPCDAAFSGDQDDLAAGALAWTTAGFTALPEQATDDNIDDFFEIWALPPGYDTASPAEDLAVLDCDANTDGVQGSPRGIAVFLITALDADDGSGCGSGGGNSCYEVRGVAGIYLEGCSNDGGSTVKKDFSACSGTGSLQIYGRLVATIGDTPLNLGYEEFGSWQTFLKE